MPAYLTAEEGTLIGLTIEIRDEHEWIIGRDPDSCNSVLEDSSVSRMHVIIRKEPEGFFLENLSSTNPASVNGEAVTDPILLHEGDTIQIGATFFHYSEQNAQKDEAPSADKEEVVIPEELGPLSFTSGEQGRWMLKVISGPNTGAEFNLQIKRTYIIGKDTQNCDIFFQDLSVSKQHAKIVTTQDSVTIEDLNSRNGTLINGNLAEEGQLLKSQDLISMGTTSFLMIDYQETSQTIYAPPATPQHTLQTEEKQKKEQEAIKEEIAMKRSWKDLFIPTKHIVIASLFVLIIFIGLFGVVSLFKTSSVELVQKDAKEEIRNTIKKFPTVEFNFNENSGKLFLVGHVLTDIDHQELMYLIHTLSFVHKIDDNVIIDEFVWEDANALIYKNPKWRSVLVTAPQPGKFVLRGYLPTLEDVAELTEYVNQNFPYLDLLENKVVVENTLQAEIQSQLISKGFANVTFQFNNGELILAGRVHVDEEDDFEDLTKQFENTVGITDVKNFVVFTGASTSRVNITSKYTVTGTSKFGDKNEFVMIDGKILSSGDQLDGMMITAITDRDVLLEKDGIKYKIDYNL